MDRVRRLNELGISAEVRSDIFGDDYGRFLNRARIGFNRSIRGEMNLRAFEVPACGGLLFMEEQNREIREFLTPGEEVVLYNNDNFEELVRDAVELLPDDFLAIMHNVDVQVRRWPTQRQLRHATLDEGAGWRRPATAGFRTIGWASGCQR